MGRLLFLLFTVIPLVEVWLLVKIGAFLGFGGTLALVVLTGAVGAALAKSEGRRALTAWQRDLAAGRVPKDGVLDGVLLLVGGIFLVTPGVLTDVVGLSLLIPPIRRIISATIRRRTEAAVAQGRVQVFHGGFPGAGFPGGGFPGGGFPGGFPRDGFPGADRRPQVVEIDGEEIESTTRRLD
ncbi:MAG: FxsA family protein [Myxococcota bacterium]